MRRTLAYLDNFICYTDRPIDPVSTATPRQKQSLGTRYPLKNYVTCTKFSSSHQQFLAAITKVTEPKFYHEAVQDEKWRKALSEEISALEKNRTWNIETLPS